MAAERQLTTDSVQKDLDNNINFSPNGKLLVFDCRGRTGLAGNTRVGVVDVRTGKYRIVYTQKPPDRGMGAPSFLDNNDIIEIHCLPNGVLYDFDQRGGMIVPIDGGPRHWLDSRNIIPPFTPGALRGGTHKHEPDSTGEWVGFTYNDYIMKTRNHSDLRNCGVAHIGTRVVVPTDGPDNRNIIGESFAVLLTAAVDHPKPGSDEYDRADGDCWVGTQGYPLPDGKHQRARAFRGEVVVDENGTLAKYGDIYVVDVPDDITAPGPLGPLQGTETDYPKPPKGAIVRRLTHTADSPDVALRGTGGSIRASGDGRWIAYGQKVRSGSKVVMQAFVVSAATGEIRQLSDLPDGIAGDLRFSPDSRYVATVGTDGGIWRISAEEGSWGKATRIAPASRNSADNVVISPDSKLVAYNRTIDGVQQVFVADVQP